MDSPQIIQSNTSNFVKVNQAILEEMGDGESYQPTLDPGQLESFQIAVFLLSYERGGDLGYSWLH